VSPSFSRIIHIASGREWRGGQNQVFLLARELARTGTVEQTVVTTRESELARRLKEARVPVQAVGWRAGLSPSALFGALRAARGAGAALFHAHDAHAVSIAAAAGLLTGIPFVATRRVDFHLRRPATWKRARQIIAISEAVRQILIQDGIDPARIPVVHSGIDVETVRAAGATGTLESFGLRPGQPYIANVAALVPHKDQATLVEAAAILRPRHPDLQWLIAGEGTLRSTLEAQIRSLDLENQVRLLGQIANPQRLIAGARAFVMSSEEEGLGTSILDAMALGVPIVATRAGGIPEILGEEAGALMPTRNPAALAAAVAAVLDAPDHARSRVAAAHRRLERFTAAGMAAGVLAVYRSIA
jgi:glycosyltransferase involved in cell wall biosynthesis